MNTYSAIGRLGLVIIVLVVIIVAAIGIEAAVYSQQKVTSTTYTSTGTSLSSSSTVTSPLTSTLTTSGNSQLNFISISGLSLCSSNCGYPSPFLSGSVLVNSSAPLRMLQLYINATFENSFNYSNNFTNYVIEYKVSPKNQSMPIVSGKAYFILVVATFQDNSQSPASTFVTADFSPSQTSQSVSSASNTCTPAMTVTQNNATEVITLCHHQTTSNTTSKSEQ